MKKKLCLALLVACAASGTAFAQARSNYIPRTERGQLVANIVQRWSGEAAKKIGITPAGWAKAMGGAFGHASIEQLRKAVSATRLEDMVANLQSSSVNATLSGPASVYHHIPVCPAWILDMESDRTFSVDAKSANFCPIPATATGVVLQVTAKESQGTGQLFVYPSDEPLTSWTGQLFYQPNVPSDHLKIVGGTNIEFFNFGATTEVHVNIVGYFEPAPVAKQNCTVTAQSAAEVPDTGNKFTLAPPACPTGTQLMSVSCEAGDRAARLRGNTPTACSFDDVTPLDGKKGWGFAQARCCSVDN